MASVETIMQGARIYMRDNERYFSSTVTKKDTSNTFELPHRNVKQYGLFVAATDGTTTVTGVASGFGAMPSGTTFIYAIDERNGLLRILAPPTAPGTLTGFTLNVEGYYYEWVSEADLRYFAANMVAEHAWHTTGYCLDETSDQEEDALALGTACEAFWSLLAEYSRDIDINTPEGVALPVTQRFHQVTDLLYNPGGLLEKYKDKANMIGVGMDKTTVGTLRRVSYTTNRLIPVYRPREYDDASRPTRVFPAVDPIAPATPPPGFKPAPWANSIVENPSEPGAVVP